MRKTLSLLLLVALPVAALFSSPRTPEQALSLAGQFMQHRGSVSVQHAPSAPLRVSARSAAWYVVRTGDAFVVVSADDRLPDILGWSDPGAFEFDTLPPGVMGYLAMFDNELQMLDSAGVVQPYAVQAHAADVFADTVAPLIATNWAQGVPYNSYCPRSTDDERCATGCVATAMAQIMKFWSYPTRGTGSHSYEWTCKNCDAGYGSTQTLSANFATTTYDWASMRDTYPSNEYTTTEAAAVARLMYHCGVAVNMEYGKRASSATVPDALYALATYFGYSKQMELLERKYYTPDRLRTLVHDELVAGRPVLARGVDSDAGGHAFVCDGFNRAGYFHFNWGWSGTANGYFLLTALDPSTKNANYHYNDNVRFVTHISPDPEQSSELTHKLMVGEGMYMQPNAFALGDTLTVYVHDMRIRSPYEFAGRVGLCIFDASGSPVNRVYESGLDTLPGFNWGWTTYRVGNLTLPNLADGQYTLDVVYKTEDSDTWLRAMHSDFTAGAIRFSVQAGYVSCAVEEQTTDYSTADSVLLADEFSTNYYATSRSRVISWSMSNLRNSGTEDFYGYYGLALCTADGDSIITMLSGLSNPMTISASVPLAAPMLACAIPQHVADGTYMLKLVCKGTSGTWQPIRSTVNYQPLQTAVYVSPQTVVLRGLRLAKQIAMAEGQTVPDNQATVRLVIADGMDKCKVMLAVVFSNNQTAVTDSIMQNQPYELYANNWSWVVKAEKMQAMLDNGALSYDALNTARLVWKLDENDTYRDFLPDGYGQCTFRVSRADALDTPVEDSAETQKIIINNQLFIRHQGKTYTAGGAEVK